MLYDLDGHFGRIDEREIKLRAFESGWLTSPGSYRADVPSQSSLRFEDQVMRWLFSHSAMLIGEVIPLAYDYLRENADLALLENVNHLLVDEYQDLNYLEQELIEYFVNDSVNVVIIGDDDQSIYSFKHAHPDGILEQAHRANSEVIELDTCHRSPQNIVQASNDLIERQPDRLKGRMKSFSEVDGYVARVQWPRFEDEVEGVAAAIAYDVNIRRIESGEILVLVPNRRIGIRVRDQLARNGIDAKGFFDQELFDQAPEAQEALALLQLVAKDDDPVAWRVLLGIDHQQGRADRYRLLRQDATAAKKSPIELLDSIGDRHPLRRKYPKFLEIHKVVSKKIAGLRDVTLNDLVERLMPSDGVNIGELREIALSVLETAELEDVDGLLEQIMRRVSFEDVPENPSYVRVMSLHKSKGLTANHVFILSLVEGLVPNYSHAETPEEKLDRKAEARRLLYVGITRSAQELVLSSFRSIPIGDALASGLLPSSKPLKSRVGSITSSLVGELGESGGSILDGNLWLPEYLQRIDPPMDMERAG